MRCRLHNFIALITAIVAAAASLPLLADDLKLHKGFSCEQLRTLIKIETEAVAHEKQYLPNPVAANNLRLASSLLRQAKERLAQQCGGSDSDSKAEAALRSGRRLEAAARAAGSPGSGLGRADIEQLLSRAEDTYSEAASLFASAGDRSGQQGALADVARIKAAYGKIRDLKRPTKPQGKRAKAKVCAEVMRRIIASNLEGGDTSKSKKQAKATGCN